MVRPSTIVLALWGLVAAVVSAVAVQTPAVDQPTQAVVQDGVPPSLPSRAHPAVLFIGDSYTQGVSTPDLSYGCMAATRLGWECNIAAQSATGYVSGGPGNRLPAAEYGRASTSFVERLPRLHELYRADFVVLDGGRNDLQFDMNAVMLAFSYTVTQVIDAWPNSRIVVIVPWFLADPVLRPGAFAGRTAGEEFAAALASSPTFAKVDLIDPGALGWFVGADVTRLTDDGIHPNFEGAKRIADLLTAALISGGVADPS
ncbi:SGNH/GDSL hydrolase family protein [Mycobacterium sp. ACS4331]|uniref:SGNH/GDSL hydrolase family protein n=1 Tax=Mycobacterium sp. ACS4331 TaxID=1834121 RepID=UPI0007FFD140|nr:SGNH/GDSL hydrolase family protein [Mycobacterium sp. ACS4331]OBF16541.1 hypothetical protein A5727_13455 [Mycobacterium sp. ACS4331]